MRLNVSSSPFGALEIDGPIANSKHRSVQSFDVFDTLIARRCIEPIRIFEQLGVKFNIPDFAAHRRRAEAAVAATPYNLHTIYQQLAQNLKITESKAEEIKAFEIAAEMDAVVPIAENLTKVNDGDLLLSDMYLDPSVIRGLLAKAGLKKTIELIVTSHGKRSGELWPVLLKDYSIQNHLGDNPHSDIAMPKQFGIPSVHTAVAAPTMIELKLMEIGLRDLAQLVREARLMSRHVETTGRKLQMVQISFNFPILVLASVYVLRLAARRGLSRLLFASRDCNLWFPLAQTLARQMNMPCEMDYFYTSRKARIQPSPDYLAYARDRLNERSLLIDICGTGWSGALLFQALGLTDAHAFYIQHLAPRADYERKALTPRNCTIHSIIGPTQSGFSNPRFEMCNYAEHGSAIDVRSAENGNFAPVFDRDDRPDALKAYIKEQQLCFMQCLELLKKTPLENTLLLDNVLIEKCITILYGALSKDDILPSVYNASHRIEDTQTMREMGLIE